jgi:hypothetical protein
VSLGQCKSARNVGLGALSPHHRPFVLHVCVLLGVIGLEWPPLSLGEVDSMGDGMGNQRPDPSGGKTSFQEYQELG